MVLINRAVCLFLIGVGLSAALPVLPSSPAAGIVDAAKARSLVPDETASQILNQESLIASLIQTSQSTFENLIQSKSAVEDVVVAVPLVVVGMLAFVMFVAFISFRVSHVRQQRAKFNAYRPVDLKANRHHVDPEPIVLGKAEPTVEWTEPTDAVASDPIRLEGTKRMSLDDDEDLLRFMTNVHLVRQRSSLFKVPAPPARSASHKSKLGGIDEAADAGDSAHLEHLRELFDAIDVDKNGTIDKAELALLLRRMHKPQSEVSQILADFGELEKESEIDFDRFKQLVVPTSAAASQTVATLRTSSGSRRANADDAQLTRQGQSHTGTKRIHHVATAASALTEEERLAVAAKVEDAHQSIVRRMSLI